MKTTVYTNGDIITMNDENPEAEAIAVRDGKILAVGSLADVEKTAGLGAEKVDLGGKTLMPAFFDPHGHFFLTTLLVAYADLNAPPVGKVDSIAGLQQTLRDYANEKNLKADDWIVGMNYDDTGIKEQRHPTRYDLDEVSTTNPIYIMHSSSHFGVANSKALELAGITSQTEDPSGGAFLHDEKGEPNGVLEENPAFLQVMSKIKLPDMDVAIDLFVKTLIERYAAQGVTTVQECGGALPPFIKAMRAAGEKGKLPLDVIAYPKGDLAGFLENYEEDSQYKNRFRFGGLKLIVDGSIQGYTAYLSEPYYVAPEGRLTEEKSCDAEGKVDLLFATQEEKKDAHSLHVDESELNEGFRGKPTYTQGELDALVLKAISKGWHLAVHCNGDGSVDMLLKSMRKALGEHPVEDHRTTIIHAQTIRDDQLDEAKELGMVVSLFPGHIYYWGDRHAKTFLGPERTARMNPMQEVLKRGIPLTIHNDTPVTPSNMLDVVAFAVNRVSIGGQVIGKEQELSVWQALHAVTIDSAWQHGEENSKGSLEVGKLADLMILSDNPLKIEKTKIREIQVLETFKEGESVYRKD